MNVIGYNIRRLRLDAKLTQAELAHQLGEPVLAVSYWEDGTYYPGSRLLIAMATLFDVEIIEFLLPGEVQ